MDEKIDTFNKKYITDKGSRIILTNSEIKNVMKVI